MESLAATRTELLDRRRRAVLVDEGRDLLQDKRTALVREFREHQAEPLEGWEEMRKLAVRAHLRLEEAIVVCGPEPPRVWCPGRRDRNRRRAAIPDRGRVLPSC